MTWLTPDDALGDPTGLWRSGDELWQMAGEMVRIMRELQPDRSLDLTQAWMWGVQADVLVRTTWPGHESNLTLVGHIGKIPVYTDPSLPPDAGPWVVS